MFYSQLLRVPVNAVAQMVKLSVDVCRLLNSVKYHGIYEFCNYKLPFEIDLFLTFLCSRSFSIQLKSFFSSNKYAYSSNWNLFFYISSTNQTETFQCLSIQLIQNLLFSSFYSELECCTTRICNVSTKLHLLR